MGKWVVGEAGDWKYDVAFSVLSADAAAAQAIIDALPAELSCFLFAGRDQQVEIVGEDGLDAFTSVFRDEARLCVVLFRPGWGETPWTRVEEEAMKDRRLAEGLDFLLLVNMTPGAGQDAPSWFPKWSLWAHFGDLGAEGIAAAILRKLEGSQPDARIPSMTATRDALPISFYQTHKGGRYGEQYVPIEPEMCDGCGRAVRFRPINHITVNADGFTARESFCPPCARDRGIVIVRTDGLSEEELFAPVNPTLSEHVRRLLIASGRALRAVESDDRVRSCGVDRVGAVIVRDLTAAVLSIGDDTAETPLIPFTELEAAGALTVPALADYLVEHIVRCFEQPDDYPLRWWNRDRDGAG